MRVKLVLALVLAIVGFAGALARADASGGCDPAEIAARGGQVVLTAPQVVVAYNGFAGGGAYDASAAWSACVRATGITRQLDREPSGMGAAADDSGWMAGGTVVAWRMNWLAGSVPYVEDVATGVRRAFWGGEQVTLEAITPDGELAVRIGDALWSESVAGAPIRLLALDAGALSGPTVHGASIAWTVGGAPVAADPGGRVLRSPRRRSACALATPSRDGLPGYRVGDAAPVPALSDLGLASSRCTWEDASGDGLLLAEERRLTGSTRAAIERSLRLDHRQKAVTLRSRGRFAGGAAWSSSTDSTDSQGASVTERRLVVVRGGVALVFESAPGRSGGSPATAAQLERLAGRALYRLGFRGH